MSGESPTNPEEQQEDVSAWNLAIVESLADGVHPMTGDELDEASIFKDPKVRRALSAAKEAMEKQGRLEIRRTSLPKKAGQPWSEEEDAELVGRFEDGAGFAELAREHGRTAGAVRSRLTKLGKLIPEH